VKKESKTLILYGPHTLYGHIGYTLPCKERAVDKAIKLFYSSPGK